jgi:hypothetical protein
MDLKKKRAIILGLILVIIAAALFWVYNEFAPNPTGGDKTITVEITHLDGTVKNAEIKTNEEFLRGALEQEGLVSGVEMEYGLWVQTVDGETADDSQEQWWGFTKSGEYVETGVDATVIEDGDHFEFTLNVGY